MNELKSVRKKLNNFPEEFRHYLGRSGQSPLVSNVSLRFLLEGERKSIQPMSPRLPGGNEQA